MIIFRDRRTLSSMLAGIAVLLVLLSFGARCFAEEVSIGVVYPEVREPYNQIFLALRDGVAAGSEQKVESFLVSEATQTETVIQWLKDKNVNGLVMLGNRGLALAHELKAINLPLVVGGTFIDGKPEHQNLSGISMAPAPRALFTRLLKLFPNTRTINVVYEPEDKWLIEQAQVVANDLGVQLNTVSGSDIRDLASAYQQILRTQKSKTEALWLPYSGKSLEKALLNEVLEKAWRRDLTVFSSNLADVNKGILFSLYPDNDLMGRRLAELLLDQSRKGENAERVVLLAEDLFAALNTRTAEHLGIRLGMEEKSEYKILFPLKR